MQDGGVLPASGFPRDSGMETSDKRTRCKNGHLIQHAFGPRTSSRCYTFEACVFGADRVRYDVEEVDVLGSSWEVVVYVATVVVHLVDVHGP